MTQPTNCDGCDNEYPQFSVSNRDTGDTQFLGVLCLASMGATILIAADTDLADIAFKAWGYEPDKAAKAARKKLAAADPESVPAVVESSKDAPGSESEPADELADAPPY